MEYFIVFVCFLGIVMGKPADLGPITYTYGPAAYIPAPSTYIPAPLTLLNIIYPHTLVAHQETVPVEKSQYYYQNALGFTAYGHSEPQQTHNAIQDPAGNKNGSYKYIAPNGEIIQADYVADAMGFKIESNALPIAPVNVQDAPAETPEVIAARNAHLIEHEKLAKEKQQSR